MAPSAGNSIPDFDCRFAKNIFCKITCVSREAHQISYINGAPHSRRLFLPDWQKEFGRSQAIKSFPYSWISISGSSLAR